MRGTHVRLASFQARASAPNGTPPHEDYWRLIGSSGEILETDSSDDEDYRFSRYLVRFDVDVAVMGLVCHNPVPNTLWILKSDLRILTGKLTP